MLIRLSRQYVIPSDVLSQEILDGEVVLLDMTTGTYYGMNRVASRVWQHIQQDGTLEAAVGILAEEYGVPETQLREDVSGFVEGLISAGLLRGKDEMQDIP